MNTKIESYIKTISEEKPLTRQTEIIEILQKYPNGLTASEILYVLGKTEMNYVRPRLTEVLQAEKVVESGLKLDKDTNRTVHVFKAVV